LDKSDYSTIFPVELFELKRVEKKEEQDIAVTHLSPRLGAFGSAFRL
jgi:hypothetical protein